MLSTANSKYVLLENLRLSVQLGLHPIKYSKFIQSKFSSLADDGRVFRWTLTAHFCIQSDLDELLFPANMH